MRSWATKSRSASAWGAPWKTRSTRQRMAVVLADGLGHSIDEPSAEQMREVLEDLDPDDVEHAAAWLSDEAGNTLEWNIDGRLVYDKQSLPPRHMTEVAAERV